jgi:hypothetical protein
VGVFLWARYPCTLVKHTADPSRGCPAVLRVKVQRLVFYCRTTSASTAPGTSRKMCCPSIQYISSPARVIGGACTHPCKLKCGFRAIAIVRVLWGLLWIPARGSIAVRITQPLEGKNVLLNLMVKPEWSNPTGFYRHDSEPSSFRPTPSTCKSSIIPPGASLESGWCMLNQRELRHIK